MIKNVYKDEGATGGEETSLQLSALKELNMFIKPFQGLRSVS